MSKQEEARVRDELLQSLYVGMLRAAAQKGGWRAVAAGVNLNLRPSDWILGPRRSVQALNWMGDGSQSESNAGAARASSAALPDEEQAAVAFALGIAAAMRGEALVCVFLPPSASFEGDLRKLRAGVFPRTWSQAGVWAAARSMPMLFVSAAGASAGEEPAGPPRPALPYPTIPVDREDALAVYRVAYECALRARAGSGPSRILAVPYRARGQRPEQAGPLSRVEAMLRARGAFTKAWRRQVERRVLQEAV